MKIDLRKKTAIISGGTHGIGLSTALKLAEYGCSVFDSEPRDWMHKKYGLDRKKIIKKIDKFI